MNRYTEEEIERARTELIELYKHNHNYIVSEIRWHKQYLNDIVNSTCPACIKDFKTSTKRYWFMHNISEFPTCSICGKQITRNVINAVHGYTLRTDKENLFCCECSKKSKHYIQTQRQRIIERFGKINAKSEYPDYVKDNEHLKYTRRLRVYNKLASNRYVKLLCSFEEFFHLSDRIKQLNLKWKCLECGNIFESPCNREIPIILRETGKSVPARCPICYPPLNMSSMEERHLAEELKKRYTGCCVIHNTFNNWKVIPPYQLDIVVKQNDEIILAIEYNGVHWHSLEMGKSYDAQFRKTAMCERLNIPLVHIYEDEVDDLKLMYENWNLIDQLIKHPKQLFNEQQDDIIVLKRDKISLAVSVQGYDLIDTMPVQIVKRKNGISNFEYSVPDCGKLVFKRRT